MDEPKAPPSTVSACSVSEELYQIKGIVIRVRDGDSITIRDGNKAATVRLKGIDAPELAQPFGVEAQRALSQIVLNRSVTVSYTKVDQYNRIVGRVHTEGCIDAGEHLLSIGMAWFYSAFQCELSRGVRTHFKVAEEMAKRAGIGLWNQMSPEPPWLFRNGKRPKVPRCVD